MTSSLNRRIFLGQLGFRDLTRTRILSCETITAADLKAVNTFAQPRTVVPRPSDAPGFGARMTFRLPARSYTGASLASAW